MVIALYVADVTKSFGGRHVLEGVSWELADGETVGLIGPNGAGKSTLLRLIAGLDDPDAGTISRQPGVTVGYLPQEPVLDPAHTILEEVLAAHAELARLDAELRALEARMGEPAVYEDGAALQRVMEAHARATEQFERLDGRGYRGRVERTLRRLGFDADDFDRSTVGLSGGEKKLVALARVLTMQPSVLLLDEPDNHLDLAGKALLERVLAEHRGAVAIISHDRYLLDVVADVIAEMEPAGRHPGRPQLSVFDGNYSEYMYEKRLALEQQEKLHVVQEREAERLRRSILRLKDFSSGGQNEKMVRRWKSMEKRLDKLPRTERPIMEPRRMGLTLTAERGSKRVLELMDVRRTFGEREVLRGIDLLLLAGERVGLVGPNGAGKSVLFGIVLGADPDGGTVKLGPSIAAGYYAQEHETLDPALSAVEHVRRGRTMTEGDAVAFLGRFLFDFDTSRKPVRTLSGGEKSRLQLAVLMLQQPNLLLLDEPTNNLDVTSSEVLEDAIDDYPGTMLAISHDRYFLERVAGRVVELVDGRLTEYPGGYAEYRARDDVPEPEPPPAPARARVRRGRG
ncbi:MAG: ABC-F family ATP-binding cassette domain-containing protein [Dehalococcoidia bacterium]